MKTPDLAHILPRFFTEHLVEQRNVSPRTVAAYRDTFRLLLRFLQRSHRSKRSAWTFSFDALTASNVLAFLSHLEQERRNSIRSRNARLAAIRSFLHYASDLLGPELPEQTRRVLSIPWKRHTQPLLGFLSREEVQAILGATDSSWTGRRDQLLFQLLYNTGARVSELTSARVRDVLVSDGSQIQLHGKGRKTRVVPLWRQTQKQVRHWIKVNNLTPDAPLLPNRFGQPMSRSGVAWQLRKAVGQVPSLLKRRISPHTFRHTIAMHLLQSGVAPEIIALWLGHESPNTTHLYVEADLEMKRRTLDKISPIPARRKRAKQSDQLLNFLDKL
jgi:site-specific recombinase XerD